MIDGLFAALVRASARGGKCEPFSATFPRYRGKTDLNVAVRQDTGHVTLRQTIDNKISFSRKYIIHARKLQKVYTNGEKLANGNVWTVD